MKNNEVLDCFKNAKLYSGKEAEEAFRKYYYGSNSDLNRLILYPGKETEVLEYLSDHLDSKPVEAILLLIAAREVGLTRFLTYKEATSLFGDFVAESTFNKYYRKNRSIVQESVDSYKAALIREFPKLDGNNGGIL